MVSLLGDCSRICPSRVQTPGSVHSGGEGRVGLIAAKAYAALQRQGPIDDHTVGPAPVEAWHAGAVDRARLDGERAHPLEVATKLCRCAIADERLSADDRVLYRPPIVQDGAAMREADRYEHRGDRR